MFYQKKKKPLTDRGVDLSVYNTFYLLSVFHKSHENHIHDVTCRETPVQKRKSRSLKTKYKLMYFYNPHVRILKQSMMNEEDE